MLALLAEAAAYLQKQFPVNRVVVLLTPLVFVPVAGFVTAWVAQHFPGLPQFDAGQVTGFFVAGATAALTAAYRWLKGWEAHEAQIADPKAHPLD